jgi:hypothetical protein
MVQDNRESSEWNGTYQFLVYVDSVILLGEYRYHKEQQLFM